MSRPPLPLPAAAAAVPTAATPILISDESISISIFAFLPFTVAFHCLSMAPLTVDHDTGLMSAVENIIHIFLRSLHDTCNVAQFWLGR